MVTYQAARFGGGIVADGKFVPPDTRNRDWQAYQAFVAEGGTAGDPPAEVLSDEKAAGKARVNGEARRRAHEIDPRDAARTQLIEEARFADTQLTLEIDIEEADVPLLAARMAKSGETYEVASAAILSERDAALAEWAKIEAARTQAHTDIDAAASAVAIDAVVAGIDWSATVPPLDPGQDQTV